MSLPTLVKRDFPHRTGAMTGAYSMVLTGGGALAAAVTVPLQRVTGLDWRYTLGLWGLLALVTLAVWVPRARHRTVPSSPVGEAAAMRRGLLRDPLAWQVTLFMGLQSLQFYATSAWIPTIYVDAGPQPRRGRPAALAGRDRGPRVLGDDALAGDAPSQPERARHRRPACSTSPATRG